MKKSILISLGMAAVMPAAAGVTPLWLRDARISPDGKSIAFEYKGDIWKVAADGGEAVRLTTADSYEGTPVWSPDSKTIAFTSDRHGGDDIFIMDAAGGTPRRLTFNSAAETPETFTPDGKYVVYSAYIQAPVESASFPTSRLTQLYKVPVGGGAPEQMLGTTAKRVTYTPAGKMLYIDMKGHENEWRKHHTSSVTRDIWLYDPADGSHTNLTDRAGEDRDPVAVGDDLYFLSERNGGSMNVYRAPLADPASAGAVTSFKDHPVRFLSASGDGLLCYTYDGEIYTQTPGRKPAKVNITVTDDITSDPYKLTVGKPSEMAVSPDGKSIAFVYRGDVFVTSVDYKTTKQITDTPEAEKWVGWGHDSKSLVYTTERDGRYNIYRATMGRDEDPNFANATIIEEHAVFTPDSHERTVPSVSPDGKKLAFVLDRNILAVKDLETGKVRQLTDGTTKKQRNGTMAYTWSPDSKWIALEVTNRDPYTDIAIVNVDDGTLTNLTNSGYFDESPRWVLGGDALIYNSERYGMRNHASWGSEMDVMAVFLNQEAYDRFRLSKEDLELLEEKEKADKKDKKDDEAKEIVVETAGVKDRTVRLTPFSSDLKDAYVTDDGKTLYFISGSSKDNLLWKLDLREGGIEMARTIASGLNNFETSADGKTVFILGASMQKFTPSGAKLTPVTYSATMTVDPAAEREYMFDNIVREEQERFYDKKMHGVDWPKLTAHYRRFLPHINNNHDYAEMLSEMLGELNVSHTGGRMYASSSATTDRTSSLGLLYDLGHTGRGMKVAEVVTGGPCDRAGSHVRPGVIIEKIDGVEITPENDYTRLLTDKAGKKTLVTVLDPDGTRHDEVVRPISASAMGDLLYNRWVDARAADVDRLSGGRLGYVHIASMNDASFRRVYSDLLGKYADREGVVVDIRWNGGGRLHEDVEVLLTGEKYLTQMIRGNASCDMPSRRWNKPSVMIISEACYSNAHGTPWVYKDRGIGTLVGMPVPGTMTSVNWVTMQDPALYFGIPVVGYLTKDGNYLENSQLEPDIKVANAPEALAAGEDTQLRVAVETLLEQLGKQ